jgi:hypothetical protein
VANDGARQSQPADQQAVENPSKGSTAGGISELSCLSGRSLTFDPATYRREHATRANPRVEVQKIFSEEKQTLEKQTFLSTACY